MMIGCNTRALRTAPTPGVTLISDDLRAPSVPRDVNMPPHPSSAPDKVTGRRDVSARSARADSQSACPSLEATTVPSRSAALSRYRARRRGRGWSRSQEGRRSIRNRSRNGGTGRQLRCVGHQHQRQAKRLGQLRARTPPALSDPSRASTSTRAEAGSAHRQSTIPRKRAWNPVSVHDMVRVHLADSSLGQSVTRMPAAKEAGEKNASGTDSYRKAHDREQLCVQQGPSCLNHTKLVRLPVPCGMQIYPDTSARATRRSIC
jgi:hypothetical protein